MTGFYTPEEGEILLDGHEITGYSPDRVTKKGIARTYQNIRLFKNMTSVENIMVGMHPHLRSGLLGGIFRDPRTNKEEKGSVEEANRLLAYVGLKGKGDFLSKNLPYGDQRRLEIARALASKPRLLLLDEPSAGMNPSESEDLVDFIRHLRDDLGITIVLIEHHMRVVMSMSEIITVLDFGQKIAEGSPSEIQRNPQSHRSLSGAWCSKWTGRSCCRIFIKRSTNMAMLEVDNIHSYYGSIHALKGISLKVDKGEIVTLIGANGAGKSTTLRTISGLMKPKIGRVLLEGEDITPLKAHNIVEKGVALVCRRDVGFFARLTVAENLDMGAYVRNRKDIPGELERVFTLFPRLKERINQRRRNTFGRRTADACHGSRDDDPPPSALDG